MDVLELGSNHSIDVTASSLEMKTIKSVESRECSKAIKKIVSTISTDVIRDGLIPILIDVGGIVPAGKK